MKKLLSTLLLLVAGSLAPLATAQTATTPYSAPVYYASAFAGWSINGQSPNTYVFQGRTLCNANAQNLTFFTFNTNAPVLIADANTANSEVVTPSAIIQTAGSCGVTVSPSHNHYTFQLRSGTGGLQEAINNLSGSVNLPGMIDLDRNWYAYAANVPGTTPQAIIAGATGNANIVLVDITTSPQTFYFWDGAKYSASLAAAPFFNLKSTSYTAISPPTALSTAASANGLITTATTGGTIPATSTYRLAATYVDASGGETLISTDSASTSTVTSGSTATNTISVTSPAAATGAVGWRLYMTAATGASGAEILYAPTCTAATGLVPALNGVCAIGATATISAVVTGTATVPAIASAYPRAPTASESFPPFAAGTTIAASSTATIGLINFPPGYLNTLGRSIRVCGNGNATTNSTPGTLTLATKLFSVAGVTSITPFTAVSGTTTASATVPFNFCVTYTTAATGSSGTLWAHGWVSYALAGTAPGTIAQDIITAVSSAIDLTRQDQMQVTLEPLTTAVTAYQLTQLDAYPSN